MAGRKGTKNLTIKEYEMIKALLNAGVKNKVVKKVSARGETTVSIIKTSTDFKDYKKIIQDKNSKKPSVVKPSDMEKLEEAIKLVNKGMALLGEAQYLLENL